MLSVLASSTAAHADRALVKMESDKSCAQVCNSKGREPVYLGDAMDNGGSYLCAGWAKADAKHDATAGLRGGQAPKKGGACQLVGGASADQSFCACAPKDFDQMYKATKP